MKVSFLPSGESKEAASGVKLLVVARQARLPIRFGCAACACGTCAVLLTKGQASPMNANEKQLLEKIKLPIDGKVRLSCQARVFDDDLEVDLSYQDKYSPDEGFTG